MMKFDNHIQSASKSEGEWNPEEPGVLIGKCASCGLRKLVVKLKDPYIEDVYPVDNLLSAPFCKPCWDERKDQV